MKISDKLIQKRKEKRSNQKGGQKLSPPGKTDKYFQNNLYVFLFYYYFG